MKTTFLCLFQSLFLLASSIDWTYNPGCNDTILCGTANMLHVRSERLQYIWSTDGGLAGAVFQGNGDLAINWTKYKAGRKCISANTDHLLGWHFNHLTLNNTNKNHNQVVVDLTKVKWRPILTRNLTGSGPDLVFRYESDFMSVMVNVSINTTRMEHNPKMVLNENNTLFNVYVNMSKIPNVVLNTTTTATIGIMVTSGKDVILQKNRTFDDEHTPALFEYKMLVDDYNEQVYMQWRPVVYVDNERKKIALLRGEQLSASSDSSGSLLSKLLDASGKYHLLSMNVLPPDGASYVNPEIYWTGVLGQGKPQSESLSTFGVIITILIVGLPILTMLLGSIFIICKKQRAPPGQGYREI